MTTTGQHRSHAARCGWALLALCFGGCAGGMPRLDPSGRGLLVVDPPIGSSSVTTIAPPPTGAAAPGCAPIVTPPVVMTPAPALPTIPVPAPPVVLPSAPEVVLQLAPADTIAPVGSEVTLVAGVFGSQQVLQPRQRVEWTIDPSGVGHVATISQRAPLDWLFGGAGSAQKIDADYAISSTATRNYILNRGTASPADDLPITAGQTWISVSSPAEGISHVTAFAPQLGAWQARQRTARIYWIDAQWSFPPSTSAPTGGQQALTTSLLRLSDRTALTGYRVRYSIAGGAPASFGVGDGQSIELETNAQGEATVDLQQTAASAGTTDVRVEVIRPGTLSGYDGRTLTVATGMTRVSWSGAGTPITSSPPVGAPFEPAPIQPAPVEPEPTPTAPAGPQLSVRISNPPAASVGDVVRCEITIANLGTTATGPLLVRDEYDAGLEHEIERSAPGQKMVELDLASIAPGQSRTQPLNFTVITAGEWRHTVTVYAADGTTTLAQEQGNVLATDLSVAPPPVTTPYEPPPSTEPAPSIPPESSGAAQQGDLLVEMAGPASGNTGDEPLFTIKVTNNGTTDLHDVTVLNQFDPGFTALQLAPSAHERVGEDIRWTPLATLAAGASKTFKVKYRCVSAGNSITSYVTVTCREQLRADDQASMSVRAAASKLSAAMFDSRDPLAVGKDGTYDLRITNNGTSADTNVVVTITLPPELTAVPAGIVGPGGIRAQRDGQQVRFEPLAEIRPGEPVSFRVVARGVTPGAARVTAEIASSGLAQTVAAEAETRVIAATE
jgi:uncharacterized repeat protein (TIGR01451 family)